jgi:hypothetical protein
MAVDDSWPVVLFTSRVSAADYSIDNCITNGVTTILGLSPETVPRPSDRGHRSACEIWTVDRRLVNLKKEKRGLSSVLGRKEDGETFRKRHF